MQHCHAESLRRHPCVTQKYISVQFYCQLFSDSFFHRKYCKVSLNECFAYKDIHFTPTELSTMQSNQNTTISRALYDKKVAKVIFYYLKNKWKCYIQYKTQNNCQNCKNGSHKKS